MKKIKTILLSGIVIFSLSIFINILTPLSYGRYNSVVSDTISLTITKPTYQVKFDANGGTGEMNNQSFKYDEEKQLLLNSFTRESYFFNGWNTKANGTGDSYSDGELVKNLSSENNSEVVLYAQWKSTITNYKVRHMKMNVTGVGYTFADEETISGTIGEDVTPPTKNYEGFLAPSTQTVTVLEDEGTIVEYNYERLKYTLTLTNTDYIESSFTSDEYYYDTEITLTAKNKTGYSLSKWTNNETLNPLVFKLKNNTEVGPEYSPNTYEVIFDANTGTGSMPNQSFTYDQSAKLSRNKFTKDGMEFDSWNTDPDGLGTRYANKQDVINLTDSGTITLYAQYKVAAVARFADNNTLLNAMRSLSGGVTNVTSIQYASEIPDGVTKINVGVSGNDLVPIYMWFDNGTMYWNSEDTTPNLSGSRNQLFKGYENLVSIDGLADWDTTGLNSLSETFHNCKKLTSISALADWDVSQVTTLYGIFNGCSSLESLAGLEDWDVSSVTSLQSAFVNNTNLSDISALANWDVSQVRSISGLFQQGFKITSLEALRNWNVGNVTEMIQAFQKTAITSLEPLRNWDVSKVKDMRMLFYQSENITSLEPLSDWQTTSLTNLQQTFAQLKVINDLTGLENWDVSHVTNFSSTFDNSAQIRTLDKLASWDVSSGTNYNAMFYGLRLLTAESAAEINGWHLNPNASFSSMFKNASNKPTFSFEINGELVPGTWDSNGTLIVPTE